MAPLIVKLYANKEIRRFQLDAESDGTAKFEKLVSKVAQLYPSQSSGVKLAWKDEEGDLVSITNDEELKEAKLATPSDSALRIYLLSAVHNDENPIQSKEKVVQVEPEQPKKDQDEPEVTRDQDKQEEPKESDNTDPTLHSGVTCDGCKVEVKGQRYKCLSCQNYDLCQTCKANAVHNEHHMICIQSPKDKSWVPAFMSYRIPFFPPPHHRMHHQHQNQCCQQQQGEQQSDKQQDPVQENPATDDTNKSLHKNVTCNGCNGKIDGTRFKCLTCFNYDLCQGCQEKDVHPEHAMLCIVPTRDQSWRRAFIYRRFPAFFNRRFTGGMPHCTNPNGFTGFPGYGMCCRRWQQRDGQKECQQKTEQEKHEEQSEEKCAEILGSLLTKIISDLAPILIDSITAATNEEDVEIEINKKPENQTTTKSENLSTEENAKLEVNVPQEHMKNETHETAIITGKPTTTVHMGVYCDGCKIGNIDGLRFKCMVCPDYDLCEPCNAKHIHLEHPMIRITSPKDDSWRRMFHKFQQQERRVMKNEEEKVSEKPQQPENEKAENPQDTFMNGFVDLMAAALDAFGKDHNKEKTDDNNVETPTNSDNSAYKFSGEARKSQKVEKALENMLAMGFSNEDGWLKDLLNQKNGDISTVLDLFKPNKK